MPPKRPSDRASEYALCVSPSIALYKGIDSRILRTTRNRGAYQGVGMRTMVTTDASAVWTLSASACANAGGLTIAADDSAAAVAAIVNRFMECPRRGPGGPLQ